jgi:hypothetical protein
VDAVGQRALAEEVAVEAVRLFDASLDFRVSDGALVGEHQGEKTWQAGLVHHRIAGKATMQLTPVRCGIGDPVAPEAGGIPTFGERHRTASESGQHIVVAGKLVTLGQQQVRMAPLVH